MNLEEQLLALNLEGITYQPPMSGCTHWSIRDRDGHEIGCPHVGLPENLIQAIELISNLSKSCNDQPAQPLANPAITHPIPTPPRPLFYTPPQSSLESSEESKQEPHDSDAQLLARGGHILDENFRITGNAWKYTQTKNITPDAILDALYEPLYIQPSSLGREMYFGADLRVVLADDKRTVLSLSRLDAQHVPTPGVRRISQANHNATPRMNTADEAVVWLRENGYTVELVNNGHYKITHPHKQGYVPMAASPSDARWWLNTYRKLNLVFGKE